MSAKDANRELRRRLSCLQVPRADRYTLRAFRRGHATDMVARGARLWEVLQAGEWKSPVFLAYLKLNKVECEATKEAQMAAPSIVQDILDDSDAEDEGELAFA